MFIDMNYIDRSRSSTDLTKLINSSSNYKTDRIRFYVLFLFSYLAFNQCLFWLTFSPISKTTQIYYQINESTVNLLLNWGPIIFLPCLPLSYILLNRRHGLKKIVILLGILQFSSTSIRILPYLLQSLFNFSNNDLNYFSLICIHLGQILNAACGPLVMSPVSQLSSIWFSPNERTRATTFAIMSNNLGSTIGFLISPLIVTKPNDIPTLLHIHWILSLIGFICVFIYFPAEPKYIPSYTAQLLLSEQNSMEKNKNFFKSYLKNLWVCFQSSSFILLCLIGGLEGGSFAAWTSLFSNILSPENFTQTDSGWLGFSSSLSSIMGGFISSYLADTIYFRHSFKSMIIFSSLICFLSILYFYFSLQKFFSFLNIFQLNFKSILISVIFVGLFQGSLLPLIYESLAEIMFPLPESLSASVLVQLNNITALFLIIIPPDYYRLLNSFIVFLMGFSFIFSLFIRIDYKRRNEDERKE